MNIIIDEETGSAEEMPLVTVLVTSYNHQAFIEECILSIVHQTYKNIELIVIDDESPDGSVKIIQALSERYGFQFVQQKNTGLATVLNNGLAMAKGKYFVSVGSDDAEMPDRIEKQVALMEARPELAVCAANYIEFDETGKIIKQPRVPPARDLDFDDIFTHRKAGIKAPTAMIRTAVLREVGGYNANIQLEDIYMWLKISHAGYVIHVSEDVVAKYRKHSDNQSRNLSFMADSFAAIYDEYASHPDYQKTMNHLLVNLFAKSVRRRYPGSAKIFKRIPVSAYNLKLFFLVLRWMVSPAKKQS